MILLIIFYIFSLLLLLFFLYQTLQKKERTYMDILYIIIYDYVYIHIYLIYLYIFYIKNFLPDTVKETLPSDEIEIGTEN